MSTQTLERPPVALPDTDTEGIPDTEKLPVVAPTGGKKRACFICDGTDELDVCHECRRYVCKTHAHRALFDCFTRVTLCPLDYAKAYAF